MDTRRTLPAPRFGTRAALPRSPTAFLAQMAAAFVLATLGGAATVTRAWAVDQGDDVSRLFSFGGACVACELSGRKLPDAHFVGANFSGSVLVASNLEGAWFIGANFSKANLTRADLRGANLLGSNFVGADFTDAILAGVRGHGADFTGANLTRSSLANASLVGSQLGHVTGRDAVFTGAAMMAVNLSDGHFERASFRGANLFAANLNNSSFTGADFAGANLTEANLASADLSSAKGLTQSQIDLACAAPTTRLPAGLVAKPCHGGAPSVVVLHASAPPHGAGAPHYIVDVSGF
jgi:uncharacterized protein YjbI with pentapeptide repeats